MSRIPEAIQIVQQLRMVLADSAEITEIDTLCLLLQTRILRRMGRIGEALQILRKRVNMARACGILVLLVDLAELMGLAGCHRRALWEAELVMATCENLQIGRKSEEWPLVVHALTIYSNCLAAVGQNGKALWAAQQAVQFYDAHASNVCETLYTVRQHKVGANAFRTLASRYATADASGEPEPDQALLAVANTIGLYCELVELAPRHLPTLASSLLDFASTLLTMGRRDQSFAACQEAVSIMRNVAVAETYFLPALAVTLEQLAGYLQDIGDPVGASAVAAECADARRRFASVPPPPEYLFEEQGNEFPLQISADTAEAWGILRDSHDNLNAVEPVDISPISPAVDSSCPTYLDDTGPGIYSATILQVTSGPEGLDSVPATTTKTVTAARHWVASLLDTPIEVKLSGTPMNILWWMLLGLLSSLVGTLSLALAWNL
ncbi:hypothetical protein DFH06DRAFT_1334543 [Mycena polygramma]|nr:hypothetical protein DFH06DRAFT_1334543 [Mycena polygramma]